MTIEPPNKVGNKREKENKKDMATTTKNKKKSKRSSFMMCFNSPADHCLPKKPHRRVVQGSENVSTHKKVRKNIHHHHVEILDVAIDEFEKKKMTNGEMPGVLDAVLLANSLDLVKTPIQNNKMKMSSYRKMLPFGEEIRRPSSCNSNTCSSSSCSGSCSSTSSSASNSRSNSFDGREANNCFSQGINYNGLWLVLIILSVLMLWGKLCAILCTSTWLYFVPRRRRLHRSLSRVRATGENHDQFVNMVDTVDYNRRVVLEGFLERNNRPREL